MARAGVRTRSVESRSCSAASTASFTRPAPWTHVRRSISPLTAWCALFVGRWSGRGRASPTRVPPRGEPPRRPRRHVARRPPPREARARTRRPRRSLIGRRVGQGAANLERALERPEKQRRDTPVDTALPGVSATDRKAGGGSTARRNSKRNTARATSALEDSARDRPSRKSTRKSANRAKPDSNLTRRQLRKIRSPSARAARASAQRS